MCVWGWGCSGWGSLVGALRERRRRLHWAGRGWRRCGRAAERCAPALCVLGGACRQEFRRERTYKTKAETEAKKPVTATIVVTLLVISGTRPGLGCRGRATVTRRVLRGWRCCLACVWECCLACAVGCFLACAWECCLPRLTRCCPRVPPCAVVVPMLQYYGYTNKD